MSVILCCPKHRSYKAKRYPSSGCLTCKAMWHAVQSFTRLPRYLLRWSNR